MDSRKRLSVSDRAEFSKSITGKIVESDWFRNTRFIACYISTPTEVDTKMLIKCALEEKKRIFAPVIGKNFTMQFREVTRSSTLKTNKWGLQEPVDGEVICSKRLELVITPVVAFDAKRNRIGMGGGYYDREFAYLTSTDRTANPKLIGIAFGCQYVEKIAPNPWDIRLFRILTESGVV